MDKKYLIIPIYLWDFTQAFKVWSLALLKYGALLVDQYDAYEALELALDGIELFNGEFLLGFLRGCTCSSTNDNLCQTIEDFLNTEWIEWNGLRFTDLENEIPPITDLNTALIC
jgi:hypothetical protein